MKSLAPLHGDTKAPPIFSSPAHRLQWDTKCALTISVDDEFPGTLDAMVASKAQAVAAQSRATSSLPAVAVPVVANGYNSPTLPLPKRTSCKQLQNEWELQMLHFGAQSQDGLQTPPPSQPSPVAQPLVAVLDGPPPQEGPSLAVLPPGDQLAQPQQATQPQVAVVQGPPLQEAPTLTALPPEDPLCQPPPLTSAVTQQPPTARSHKRSRIASSMFACLLLVELWAGVASLSTSFADAGHNLFAFCEANPLLHSLLSLLHPDSLTALKSELNEWKDWVFPPQAIVWLIGGPSCTSLSSAGKQLAQNDPNSRYLKDHINIAAACGALLILLENVPYLVEGDAEHGLFSHLLQQAAALGYVLSQTWFVRDHAVGGFTQRRRVFLVWEKSDVASACGAWPVSLSALPGPKAIQDVLEHPDAIHSSCWLSGTISLDMGVEILQDKATPCGTVTRKGDIRHLAVGDLVAKKHHDEGCNRWRVMAFTGDRIELRRADRRNPDFALVKLSALAFTLKDTIRVYHPGGIGVGLRSWGEPPLRSGFAVAQLTDLGWRPRVLTAQECWKLHGLSLHTLAHLQQLGATDAQVASAAGNAITGAMSQHVVHKLLPRYQQHASLVSSLQALPYLRPVCFAPVKHMKHVVVLPVSTSPPQCMVSTDGLWALSVSYIEEGRAHKSSILRASQLATQLLGVDLDAILCGHLDNGVLVYAVPFHGPPPSSILQWKSPRDPLAKDLQLMVSLAIATSLSFCAPVGSLSNLATAVDTSEDWAQAQHDLVHMAVHLGARLPTFVMASQAPHGGDAALLDLALRRDNTARQLLHSAIHLEALSVPAELSASYLAWADCIKPLPLADLPPELYLELHDYSESSLQQLPMPDPCPPPVTTWLPRLTQPQPPDGFVPTTLQDLITPATQSKIAQ